MLVIVKPCVILLLHQLHALILEPLIEILIHTPERLLIMLQEALDSAAMLQITVPVEADLADVHHLGAICAESLELLVHQYR